MAEQVIPIPTAVQMPFGPSVVVYMFGKTFRPDGQPVNWSIRSNPEAAKLIASFAAEHEVSTILQPSPDFSARVCQRWDLAKAALVPTRNDGAVTFLRGASADGVDDVRPGEAFYIASGDCPTLVLYDPTWGRLVCAHAGRDCLWDRRHILEGAPARPSASVVTSAFACFNRHPLRTRAFICGGIAGRNFEHDVESGDLASSNARMVGHFVDECGKFSVVGDSNDGCLDLKFIIARQLVKAGLFPDMTGCDAIDTFDDRLNGEYVWWSNRRGDKQERNGILIVHRET